MLPDPTEFKFPFPVECQYCGMTKNILVVVQDMIDWHNKVDSIQYLMPYLSWQDRELLISESCESCFNFYVKT